MCIFQVCKSISHDFVFKIDFVINLKLKLKKIVLNYITPILYMRKNRFDRKFFKELEERKRSHSSLRKISQQFSKLVIACASAGVVIKLLESEDGISLDFDALQTAGTRLLGLFANGKEDLPKSEEKEERRGFSFKTMLGSNQ